MNRPSSTTRQGDEVTIGEDRGTVGPTSTVIKTKEGEVILPNSVVAQSRIVR